LTKACQQPDLEKVSSRVAKLYLGKTSDPESTLAAKRAKLSGE
jgi:hypothetical protein